METYSYHIWRHIIVIWRHIHTHICECLDSCDSGDDPLTIDQANEIQVISCTTTYTEQTISLYYDTTPTAGTFVIHFGTDSTAPLSATISSDDMATALNGLDLTSEIVTVTKAASSSPTTWTVSIPEANSNYHALRLSWRSSEIQEFICAADGGTFTLTYNGQTTANVNYDANVATLKSALEGLSNLQTVDVVYLASATAACTTTSTTIHVTFSHLLEENTSGGDIGLLSGTSVSLTLAGDSPAFLGSFREIRQGRDTCDVVEVQSIVCTATSGTFTLTYNGQTTANVNYDANVATLKSALETGISNFVQLSVVYSTGTSACTSGGSNTISISMTVVTDTAGDLDDMTVETGSLIHSAFVIAEVTKGVKCASLDASYKSNPGSQLISTVGTGGGTFKVSYRGQTSLDIPAESTAAQVKAYLMVRCASFLYSYIHSYIH